MVLHTSMLNWRVLICYGYMCIEPYMKLIWCYGFAEIYAWLEGGGGQSAMGIYALFSLSLSLSIYIYRCATFGVAVFKASMLNWGWESICYGYMCIVLYIYRSVIRCAKFGVVVFKVSMLDWRREWGQICHRYMCFGLYISASRSSKCGVVVFHGSLVDWRRGGVSVSRNWYSLVVFHKSVVNEGEVVLAADLPSVL